MSRLLALSTYELGHRPLGLERSAAALATAGHEVSLVDLAVEEWPTSEVVRAERLVCSVPMHTGLRLAMAAVERARQARPGLPVAYVGLYAPVAERLGLLGPDDLASTEGGADLLAWAGPADGPAETPLPSPLARYAHFRRGEEQRRVGAVEASIGCNHRCRHCPVPVVFDGRSRARDAEVVAAEIDRLVGEGATHLHFADPDFLNRPWHARRVAERLHAEHPGVSFDATVKVSHLLRHRELLPQLVGDGLAFVVSAFESTSDVVLARLDKGHTAADCHAAVALARAAGVEIRPSLLPFTPWTSRGDLLELFDFVAAHDLVWNVDPVQFSIRLLLPPGSLLLGQDDPVLEAATGGLDPAELGVGWRSADPLLDELQHELALAAEATADAEPPEAYRALRALVFDTFGRDPEPLPALAVAPGPPGPDRPRLSEPWFCCAEPTADQRAAIGAGAPSI